MSTISVVQYHHTSPHKLNILQQSQNSNTANREIIILRKPPNILTQTKPYEKELMGPKKKSKTIKDTGKSVNPPPVAVARRNARERNRVKQVNNGFATLRQHIPNSIAAAFETSAGRGGNKKLSKVETLRMAVEYIRSLEDILAEDGVERPENISNSSISNSYMSSTSSSPNLTSNLSYNNYMMSPSIDEDDLSSTNPTPPPHQYVRINGANYHIVSGNIYDDTENLEPLNVDEKFLHDSSLIDTDLELGNQELSLLNSMHTAGSLSPDMYSDHSMSPTGLEKNDRQMFIPVFNSRDLTNDSVKFRINPEVKMEPPVLSLQTENEIPNDSKENMIQVMAWWEQQQILQQSQLQTRS